MQYLNSSAIHAVDYDFWSGTLYVQFTSGTQFYEYYNVPVTKYLGLLAASSKGKYFAANIRKQHSCR